MDIVGDIFSSFCIDFLMVHLACLFQHFLDLPFLKLVCSFHFEKSDDDDDDDDHLSFSEKLWDRLAAGTVVGDSGQNFWLSLCPFVPPPPTPGGPPSHTLLFKLNCLVLQHASLLTVKKTSWNLLDQCLQRTIDSSLRPLNILRLSSSSQTSHSPTLIRMPLPNTISRYYMFNVHFHLSPTWPMTIIFLFKTNWEICVGLTGGGGDGCCLISNGSPVSSWPLPAHHGGKIKHNLFKTKTQSKRKKWERQKRNCGRAV